MVVTAAYTIALQGKMNGREMTHRLIAAVVKHAWVLLLTCLFVLSLGLSFLQIRFGGSPLDAISSDMRGYFERGWALALGREFFAYDTFYPPGTAFFYGILFYVFGFSLGSKVIIVAQALCVAGAAVLTALLVRQLRVGKAGALAIGVVVACYWPFILFVSYFLSEPLFFFLALLSQYLFIVAVRRRWEVFSFVGVGVIFALAALVKTQAVGIFVCACLVLCLSLRLQHLRLRVVPLVLGFGFVYLLQIGLNSSILGRWSPFIGANDAFNTYLGQSRREALACWDDHGYYYIFHNNNAFFDQALLPPQTLQVSITDRQFFVNETLKLWAEDPVRQFVRSVRSGFELFYSVTDWPLRLQERESRFDPLFYWGWIVLGVVPTLFGVIYGLVRRLLTWEQVLFLGPVVMMFLIACLSMGQPRYLIPFRYNFFILAPSAVGVFADWVRRAFVRRGVYVSQPK